MIKETTIKAVKSLPVKEVLEGAGLTFVHQGGKHAALCPLHGDKNPSLMINDDNTWHCYGCGEHGDGIKFYMLHEGPTFSEAVLAIAKAHGVRIEYDKDERTEEEKQEALRERNEKAVIYTVNSKVQEFFVNCLQSDLPGAREAREYAYNRWGQELCSTTGVGYAPNPGALYDYLRSQRISEADAVSAGVLRMSKTELRTHAAFRNRVTIPIIDSRGQIGGFTCRAMDPDDTAKYKNTSETPVLKKGMWLWGMDRAAHAAKKLGGFIVVEGAADAMRLRSVGLDNAVATMGTALTGHHLALMEDYCAKITFIPDCDKVAEGQLYGAGTKAVLKSGLMALDFAFEVNVKEIPQTDSEKKEDADSYITTREKYSELTAQPYVVWAMKTRLGGAHTEELKLEALREIAGALVLVQDKMLRDMYLDQLSKLYVKISQWKEALKQAGKALISEAKVDNFKEGKDPYGLTEEDYKVLRDVGLVIKNGAYWGSTTDGELKRVSNFILRPILMILEKGVATRILEGRNTRGFKQGMTLTSKELTSLRAFKEEVGRGGNFIWKSEANVHLTALQEYIGEVLPIAHKIVKIGWNEEHNLYAFGDGVYKEGLYYKVNELGVVKIKDESYFLPGFSSLYIDNPKIGDFDRKFKYQNNSGLTLRQYADSMLQVYGENGMICMAWAFTTIFRDIIVSKLKHFPILNLYGRKGSGKTDLAKILSSLMYVLPYAPDSCNNSSIAYIAEAMEKLWNTVYILDEYTNDLKPERVEVMKGLWGGTIRAKIGESGELENKYLHCGIILAGQYIPQDEAIFSRSLHVPFMKSTHDEESTERYQTFFNACMKGNAHLLGEILQLRETFEAGYEQALKMTEADINTACKGTFFDTSRLKNNWVEVLAAYRILVRHLDLPLNYSEMLEVFVRGLKYHNSQASKTSDTSEFWTAINSMHYQGKVKERCHFHIKYETSFTPLEKKRPSITFTKPKRLIYINFAALQPLLIQWNSRRQGNTMNISTLDTYLTSLPQYLGKKQHRFQFLKADGTPDEQYRHDCGKEKKILYGNGVRAYCFDYDDLEEKLDINLETIEMTEDFDKETENLFGDPQAQRADLSTRDDAPF
ncbi:MAG: CHC2 zinc finger domain-containing protein [Muribaculaceae bacterium]|nr:CHC2 zinc finger domain-containing protein [Muribaculaceae bacterium]